MNKKRIKHKKYSKEELILEALKYTKRWAFQKGSPGAYSAAYKIGILGEVCSHMKILFISWTKELIEIEALKYNNIKAFQKGSQSAYNAARRLGILKTVCSHMKCLHIEWTLDAIKTEALKYTKRWDFQKNSSAYYAAKRLRILDIVCAHMDRSFVWTESLIGILAMKCKTKKEFRKNYPGAASAARKMGFWDKTCSKMEELHHYWTNEELKLEALKYRTRAEFRANNKNAYCVCVKRKLLEKYCQHMKPSCGSSIPEKELLITIKTMYSGAVRLRDSKVKIPNKPHIKGFDIDIYIPELNKGIEFDGTYWHSMEGLKRSRSHWSNKDLADYHQIKDRWFKSKNIEIFHIKEEEWKKNKERCIKDCLNFLGVPNER
jgi:hypothetical protein